MWPDFNNTVGSVNATDFKKSWTLSVYRNLRPSCEVKGLEKKCGIEKCYSRNGKNTFWIRYNKHNIIPKRVFQSAKILSKSFSLNTFIN